MERSRSGHLFENHGLIAKNYSEDGRCLAEIQHQSNQLVGRLKLLTSMLNKSISPILVLCPITISRHLLVKIVPGLIVTINKMRHRKSIHTFSITWAVAGGSKLRTL